MWYNEKGKENDVVLSSRIRLARNVADYPFDSKLDKTSAEEIIEKVRKALGRGYKETDMSKASSLEARSLVEKHLVSREFAEKKLPHALFSDEKRGIWIMVCEEDHIRLQAIRPGLALEEALEAAEETDSLLDEGLNIAFDEKLGYLTHCPTNLGIAMRASAMLHLPALTLTHAIKPLTTQLANMGLTIRGAFGEGTEPEGDLYQISNSVTMGITEEDTVKKLSDAVREIASREREARKRLHKEYGAKLEDRLMRSYGIMKYAHAISSSEFLKYYSDLRFAVSLGLLTDLTYEKLGQLMADVLPSNLTLESGEKALDGQARDVLRAKKIRETL